MKRLIRNILALLIILAIGWIAFNFYNSKEEPINGATIQERLEQIRSRVDKTEYVSVTAASRDELDRIVVIQYQFNFTAPLKLFLEARSSQQQLSIPTQTKLQKAIKAYRHALVELFRLTMKYVIPLDPAVRTIIVDIRLPDGSMLRAIGVVEELKTLPEDAPDNVWMEKIHFVDLDYIKGP